MVAVFTMSQAVSGEILLDRLIERLMVTVLEHSGAVRGLLLLPKDAQMQIVAEALTDDHGISVRLDNFRRSLPETVLAYVTRTQEVVILDGILNDSFASDPYFRDAPSGSILCVPIVKLKRMVGVLFLENGLSTNLFTQEQVAVLELLASQAAISLENAELYQAARDTQEKARRAAEELRLAYDMRMVSRGGDSIGAQLAPYLFFFANVLVGAIAVGTIALLVKGRLLPTSHLRAAESLNEEA